MKDSKFVHQAGEALISSSAVIVLTWDGSPPHL